MNIFLYIIIFIIGSIESGYTIKNTFTVPEEKISVKVTKNWEDTEEQKDKRPEKVTLVLKSNSTEVAEQRKEITTTEDITAVTFNNLQKYDSKGNEIIYTATEEGNNKFYTVEETTGSMIDGYTITAVPSSTTEYDTDNTVTITITKQPTDSKISKTVGTVSYDEDKGWTVSGVEANS